MDADDLIPDIVDKVRRAKNNGLKVYANAVGGSLTVPDFLERYSSVVAQAGGKPVKEVSIVGRIIHKIGHEYPITYWLHGGGLVLVVEAYEKEVNRGDIVEIVGKPGRTTLGQVTLLEVTITILAPCLRRMPVQGSQSPFTFLDLPLRHAARQNFVVKTKILKFLQAYLDKKGFIEVYSPAAGEMKKMIFRGLDQVYSISSQEITKCDIYSSFKKRRDMMDLTTEIVKGLIEELTGGFTLTYNTANISEFEIDINDVPKVKFLEELTDKTGCYFPSDLDESSELVKEVCRKCGVNCTPNWSLTHMLQRLNSKFLVPVLPTLIYKYPKLVIPWARSIKDTPSIADTFRVYANQLMLGEGYGIINDPQEIEVGGGGNEEFQLLLEYGFPPTFHVSFDVDQILKLVISSQEYSRQELAGYVMQDGPSI